MSNREQSRFKIRGEAKRILARGPVFLDTETTGISPRDEIVEICVLDSDGQPLLDQLVKPNRPISPDARRLHGINESDVAGAPSWAEVAPQIQAALKGRLVAAYNADFDRRMLAQTSLSHRVSLPLHEADWFCIMKAYAQYYGQWDSYRRSFRWQSLDLAGQQCGIPLPNSHRAKQDTLLAKAILEHMAAGGE
jgi:DNA polymerase-3 subunit epsilon